jgi:hypothetical protein
MTALRSYVQSLNSDFSVIGLTETWFTDTNVNAVNIDGYHHVSSCRSDRSGGGVSLFISNRLQYTVISDMSLSRDYFESVFVEFPNGSLTDYNKTLLLGIVYRPPRYNHDEFMEILLDIFSKIHQKKAACILMRDFNYDLLTADHDSHTELFLENMYCHSFIPLINRPTRVGKHSATLIDNIFLMTSLRLKPLREF